LLEVHRCALYDEEKVFEPLVDFFHESRHRFRDAGNDAFAGFSKLTLNSLYGKFGQRITEYGDAGYNPFLPDEAGTTYDLNRGREVKYRRLDGLTEIEVSTREAHDAFPAIASYITGAARAYLTQLIDVAGWDHVMYCDTDSLFVDEDDYRALAGCLDMHTLGKLKLEAESCDLTIFAPKRYRFGEKSRSKGVRKDATQLGEGVYAQVQFESFRGAIRSGLTDRVRLHTVIKKLSERYHKGEVQPDGKVLPFVYPPASPEAPPADRR